MRYRCPACKSVVEGGIDFAVTTDVGRFIEIESHLAPDGSPCECWAVARSCAVDDDPGPVPPTEDGEQDCLPECMRQAYAQLLGPLGPAATTCAHGVRRTRQDLRPTEDGER